MSPLRPLVAASMLLAGSALVAQDGPPFPIATLLPDLLAQRPGWLRGLDMDFKMFTAANNQESFGVHYEYSRTFHPGSDWLTIRPRIVGNATFDPLVNPEDFLSAKLDLTYQYSGGGLTKETLNDEEFAAWQQTKVAAADIEDEGDLERFLADSQVTRLFSPQVTVDFGLSAGFESNQEFTARQSTFGAVAIVDLDLWGDAARFNLFDYPFALLRHLADETRNPTVEALGSTFPQVLMGLDYVTPIHGDPREGVGDTSDFWRVHLELSMRSPIAYVGDQTLFFNTSYRIFYELSASDAVQQADLDLYEYGAVSISSSSGLFVRYVSGTLPMDRSADTAFELGWSHKF